MTEGAKLRWKRKLLGLTAEQLGDLCGVTKQTILNIEIDKGQTATTKLVKYELAKVFMEWDPEAFFVTMFNNEES